MLITEPYDKHIISEEEFGELFRNSRTLFIRIANSYVHNMAVAEDITNDSFIRLWEKREEIFTENYQSYAFRTIINKCLDYLKSQQIRTSAKQDMYDIISRMQKYEIISLKGCDPDSIFASEVEAIFRETIDRMPKLTREIFIASRFDDKTYNEIAQDYRLTVRQVICPAHPTACPERLHHKPLNRTYIKYL